MAEQGRTVGCIMIVVAVVIASVTGFWLFSGLSEGKLQTSGLRLGAVLASMLILPLLGGGAFLLLRGRDEARQFAKAEKQKKILNIIQTQGQADVAQLAVEMDVTRSQVKEHIYDLVGKGLFTGYINWDEGVLYARQAAEMRTTKCPNCGGVREVVGKGTIQCPYCGSELFL
jgi:hypothetical protein